jgi:hypothetical protein
MRLQPRPVNRSSTAPRDPRASGSPCRDQAFAVALQRTATQRARPPQTQTFVGLDVHQDTIAVALLRPGTEVAEQHRRQGMTGYSTSVRLGHQLPQHLSNFSTSGGRPRIPARTEADKAGQETVVLGYAHVRSVNRAEIASGPNVS